MQASCRLKPAFVPSHARVAVLVAVAALLTLLTPASLYAVPLGAASSLTPAVNAVTEEQLTVPVRAEADGIPVSLEVAVWRPDGGGPHPAVLLAHGFGGSVADLREQGRKLAERGYLAVGYSARGFGASGGRIHLNDPEFEIADARALVDLIAARSDVVAEVRADGSRDPRVGVVGASYGGALALMLGSTDPRVDSVTAYITWNDLADAFFPQRARTGGAEAASDALPGPFKALWAARFFGSATAPARTAESPASATPPAAAPTAAPSAIPPVATPPAAAPTATPSTAKLPTAQPSPVLCGRFDPTVCRLFLAATEAGTPSPELLALLRAHSPKPLLAGLRAPTYLVQGMADSLFDLSHADATARALQAQGTPVAVRWIDGGHDGTSSTATDDEDALTAWLDTSLRDGKSASGVPGFVYAAPIPRRQSVAPLYAVPTYGVGAGSVSIPFAPVDRPRSLANPPGGTPAAVSSLGGLPIPATGGAAYQLAALPGQSVAFDTELLTDRLAIVGAPTVRLRVTSTAPSVTLFLTLWQVTGESASLPRKLVAPVTFATTPGVPTSVEVALPAATWTVEPGSRLRLLISATDSAYAVPRTARADRIELADAALIAPTLNGTRVAGSADSETDTESIGVALAIIAALLAIGAAAAWDRRQRRRDPVRPDLADIPLTVANLVKTYADGHRAVDDVSWEARRGQVVGLLGPNGAGKTTTLRMVMGLIAPDSGTAYLGSEPVHPGAPALAHVGALIEGPGFLPHLTGLANLHAFWAATGRPTEDARFDEVLDVAALGDAVHRPVRSYSHGMKQRLGIAQAMLGLPDLLVLDEPTNGLDPPQIAAMRPILQRYAAAGRTVVVSSHLLAEVEMTCSDVVVMNAGRVVATGRVADLVDSADTTVISLDPRTEVGRVGAVAEAIGRAPGVTSVEVVDDSAEPRLVVTASMPRADVVRAVAATGADVVGVSSRRHLEEVFLGVIAAAQGDDMSSATTDSGAARGSGGAGGSAGSGDAGGAAGSGGSGGAAGSGGYSGSTDATRSLSDRLRQVRSR